jgi:hypothetical protein
MERDRAWRRSQTRRVQSKRYNDLIPINQTNWVDTPSHLGKLKKDHFGCSCQMCKPYKHGRTDNLPVSQRKKLQSEE